MPAMRKTLKVYRVRACDAAIVRHHRKYFNKNYLQYLPVFVLLAKYMTIQNWVAEQQQN